MSCAPGDLLLVLFTIMASTLLSSSFALFLVRERENSSKSVQMISGAPSAAFWLANLFWDLVAFSCAAAGGASPSSCRHPGNFRTGVLRRDRSRRPDWWTAHPFHSLLAELRQQAIVKRSK